MRATYDIIKAIHFATQKHTHQRRKNKTQDPYINHPIEVMSILADARVQEHPALLAAVLHDTVEDTNTTLQEIEERFGKKIAGIVSEVTDDKSLSKLRRKQLQIEHAKTASYCARLVKIADKISNLSNLLTDPPTTWSKEYIIGYAVWSQEVVLAMPPTDPELERRFFDLTKKIIGDSHMTLEQYYNLIE